jgi:hypothetical protein
MTAPLAPALTHHYGETATVIHFLFRIAKSHRGNGLRRDRGLLRHSGTPLAIDIATLPVRSHGAEGEVARIFRAHGNFEVKGHRLEPPRTPATRVTMERGKQMSHIQLYEQGDVDYGTDSFRRSTELKFSKRRKASHGRKRGKTPTSVNGIHRRRNRKIAW